MVLLVAQSGVVVVTVIVVPPAPSGPVTIVTGPAGGDVSVIAPGAGGSGSGSQNLFIQPDAPVTTGNYMWVQTGLDPGGAGFTIWFEDGA